METGFIVSIMVVIICRLGYKYNTTKKILPLDLIDYLLIVIISLVVLCFFFIHR